MSIHTGEPGSRRPGGYCLILNGHLVSDHGQFFEADQEREHYLKQNNKNQISLLTWDQAYALGHRKQITRGHADAIHS